MTTTQPPDWVTSFPVTPGLHTEPPSKAQWQNLSQQQLQTMRQKLIDSILQIVVQAVTGAFTPGGLGSGFTQLSDWADNISSSVSDLWDAIASGDVSGIIEAITGIVGGTVTDLQNWAAQVLNIDSPLNAENLFNQIGSQLLGLIPYSHVGEAFPNLLASPSFDVSQSIDGGGVWTWDNTDGRTTNGCVQIHADGNEHRLLSNAIPVAEGDKLSNGAWAKWSGLVYTGTPFRTRVTRLSNRVQVGVDNLAAPTSPATNQTSWVNLAGATYTVPAGCNEICFELTITDTATAGTIKFDDTNFTKTGLLAPTWMTGFLGGATIADDIQSFLDTIWQAISGLTGVDKTFSDLEAILQAIPFANVLGNLGPDNIGDSLQGTVDAIVQGLSDLVSTGYGLGDMSNAANTLQQVANGAANVGRMNSNSLAMRAITKPSYHGIDPTIDGVFNLSSGSVGSVPVTSGTSVIGYVGTPDAGVKKQIVFLGSGTTGVTSMTLNLYKLNTSTGALTKLYSSGDIIGSVSNSLSWNYHSLPSANYLSTAQGDWYAVEMQTTGVGTYQVSGMAGHWLPSNAAVYPNQLAGQRSQTVAFGAASTVYTRSTNSTSFSGLGGTHTASTGDAVLVYVTTMLTSGGNNVYNLTRSCTYGGTAMTSLYGLDANGSTQGWIEVFAIANLPSGLAGAQTVAASVAGSAVTYGAVTIQVVSYPAVGAFGTPVTNYGSATSITSNAVTSAAGQMISQGFVGINTAGTNTISAYSATARYGPTTLTNGTGRVATVVGDAAGSGSVTITATQSGTNYYASIAVPLIPLLPAAPSSISSPTYSGNVPWFGLAGTNSATLHVPDIQYFSTAGSFTYHIPVWANFLDVVCLGGGGGGQGLGFVGTWGEGGHGGNWNSVTVTCNGTSTTIPSTTTTLSGTVGAGGAGGGPSGGSAGGTTSLSGTGWVGLSATGGAGGTLANLDTNGKAPSPQTLTFNSNPFYGGATQTSYMSNGQSPGGGGSGATITFVNGGAGASGAVWVVAYQ